MRHLMGLMLVTLAIYSLPAFANLCVRTALELATEVAEQEAASPGNFVFQIKLPKRQAGGDYARNNNGEVQYEVINFMNIQMFGYGSASEAAKGRMRAQAEQVREFIETIVVGRLSEARPADNSTATIKELLADMSMPFDSVTIADEGLLSRCVGLACNILKRAPYSLEQTPRTNRLAIKFGRYPFEAQKLDEMYRNGEQFTKIERLKAQAKDMLEIMGKRKEEALRSLRDEWLPVFEGAARSVRDTLERLKADGTAVRAKGGILDIIGGELEVGPTQQNISSRVQNLPEGRSVELVERVLDKLSATNFTEQVLEMGRQRQIELSIDRATDTRNVQVMLFGIQLNIGGKTAVGFEQSNSILSDLVVAREGTTEKAPNKWRNWQFNVAGLQLNEFDDIAVNVRFRKGANIAKAIHDSMMEMGF